MQADTDGKIIVNNVMLRSDVIADLLVHFCKFLIVLRKHRVAVNLKKCRFFPKAAEFVGVEVKGEGNAPAASKFLALVKLIVSPPAVVTDVLGVVGFFGFCQEWMFPLKSELDPGEGTRRKLRLSTHLRKSRCNACILSGQQKTSKNSKSQDKKS